MGLSTSVVEFFTKNPSRGTDDRITLETGRCRRGGGAEHNEGIETNNDRAATWRAIGEHPPLAKTHHRSIVGVFVGVGVVALCTTP